MEYKRTASSGVEAAYTDHPTEREQIPGDGVHVRGRSSRSCPGEEDPYDKGVVGQGRLERIAGRGHSLVGPEARSDSGAAVEGSWASTPMNE